MAQTSNPEISAHYNPESGRLHLDYDPYGKAERLTVGVLPDIIAQVSAHRNRVVGILIDQAPLYLDGLATFKGNQITLNEGLTFSRVLYQARASNILRMVKKHQTPANFVRYGLLNQ